ncbi:MAG: hypothetical protein HQ580_16585, partial [Planctomycetes bacterium]|nr:hypothetical protein [Planctomycetota bacterium]
MAEVRTKLLNDLIEEGFEIVETEGPDKYWLVGKDKLSFVWPILISKVRKVTNGVINFEEENDDTNEMEWFADEFRIVTQAGQDKEFGIIFLLFHEMENPKFSLTDKITWLSKEIFSTFPKDVSGLRFYVLDCGCIYYKRVFRDGELDTQFGTYRDANDGLCEVCI